MEKIFNSERLKQWLDEKNLTASKLAEKIGCTRQFAFYILKGTKQPSLATLKLISEATGISADDLLK